MRTWGIIAVIATLGSPALAAIDPNSGIDFVTVGAINNPAWTGGGSNNNRGSVGYEYNIGKFEVTTAQWAEFMNAAFDRPASERISFISAPVVWGATSIPANTPGGRRWTVPAGQEMYPVGGITWRTAAIFCNWLCSGKSSDRAAFLSGAYDVSTFGIPPGGQTFTDQLTHTPGASYWIPSLDEWMKAAHYDPNKPNADGTIGGWWQYSNATDTPLLYAPPNQFTQDGRQSQANSNWDGVGWPGFNPFAIPLGAYTNTVSPWGLYDVAGGTSEWTESAFWFTGETYPRGRITDGTAWATPTNGQSDDVRYRWAALAPNYVGYDTGLRIASTVPAPGSALIGACVVVGTGCDRRRRRTLVASRS